MNKLFFTTLLCCGMQAIMSPLSAMPAIEANASEAEAPDKSNTVIARIDLPAFSGIYSDVVANITIEQGNEYFIEAQGPEHLIQLIEPELQQEGGTLTIKAKKEYKVKKNGISIRIVTPQLSLIYNEGVGNICTKGAFKTQMMTITNEGVGNITIESMECERMQVVNEGVGNVDLIGKATNAVFKSEGVGNINAYNFEVSNLNADLKGVGSIECYVTERFTCDANGVGSIYYKGNPKQTHISANGLGKVRVAK